MSLPPQPRAVQTPVTTSIRNLCILHVIQFVIIGSTLAIVLDLPHHDLTVPFEFSGDAVVVLSGISAVIRSGWYWFNPLLSAPFIFPIISFPANSTLDYSIAWIVARFTTAPVWLPILRG